MFKALMAAAAVCVLAMPAGAQDYPTRPLRPWLLEIAANRCRTAMARRARRPASASHAIEDRADPRPAFVDPDDLVGELERGLQALRPEYRMVFTLFHEQNLSYDEIAAALSRPVGTIKTWLHRARAQLAESLGRSIVPRRSPSVLTRSAPRAYAA